MADIGDVAHVAIGWDDPTDDTATIEAFEARGFNPERGVVLTNAEPVGALEARSDLEIRAPEGDGEWEALLEMQLDSSPLPLARAFRESYRRRRNAELRGAIAAGRAIWRCAWLDGRIAGSMGLFSEDGLGRFQSVQTHPEFRRRGVCSALLTATAHAGRIELGARRLVIVADAGSATERIYLRHGFEHHSPVHGVCRYPPDGIA